MVLEIAALARVIQTIPSPSGNADLPNALLLTLIKLGLLNDILKSCTWFGEEISKQECTLGMGLCWECHSSTPGHGFGVPLWMPGLLTTTPTSKCSFSHSGCKFRELKKCLHSFFGCSSFRPGCLKPAGTPGLHPKILLASLRI